MHAVINRAVPNSSSTDLARTTIALYDEKVTLPETVATQFAVE